MEKERLQYINQERKAIYTTNGTFANIIRYYKWKGLLFQTISHSNSAI